MRLWVPVLSAIAILNLVPAASAGEPTLMTSADLQERIVGNTMSGQYDGGEEWQEYFDPTGDIRGRDDEHGPYTARYWIVENLMCFDYPWDGADWCAKIGIEADRLTFYKDGQKQTGIPHTQLLPGNPYSL